MASETPYHNLGTYALGDDQWDHTDTVELVDSNVPEEDTLANRPADPPVGSLFWATDARILFRYEPTHDLAGSSGWVALGGLGASADPVPGTAHLSNAALDGDLSVTGDITEGGEPIATARSTKTIDVLDHGAASDADAALDAAETAAEPHDTLLFRDNTFVFTASHTLSKPLNFRFVNAEIDDQRSNITVGEALFDFVAPGVQASDVLQADVGVGNHTITVGTAGFAAAGDTIYIEDTTGTEPITQFGVVDSVVDPGDGTQDITFEGVVRREFSANADVHIVEQWDNIHVEGAEITATHGDGELFTFEQCHRPRVEDVFAHEIGRHTVQFEECYDPSAVDCDARNAIKKGSGEGEPFICFRCTDVTFENCRAQSVRRGIDITLGTTGATIIEPHVEDFTKGGISAHDGDNIRDITVIGGEVASTDPSDNACISLAGLTENVSIYGTKLVAHRQAIYITGRADIQGVQIELAELPSADPELISVAGDNVSIQGTVHIPTYENYVRVADVRSGVTNVDLDIDVDIDAYNAGGNDNPLLQVSSGASDVTIRGTINSLADLSQPAIRLYGQTAMVENVDIETTIRGHGYEGVQLRGDVGVDGLRVTDSVIDVDDDCIRFYELDTGTSISNVWVRDCTLTSTNASGLNASGMAADTVYFLDNVGTLANAGSVTNLHSERAELDKDETVTGAWDFANGVTAQSVSTDSATITDEADKKVTVPTDYSTVHKALQGESGELLDRSTIVEVEIESGHSIQEQIRVDNEDFHQFIITSVDTTVGVDTGTFPDDGTTNSDIIRVVDNGWGPTLAAQIDAGGHGNNGVSVDRNSRMRVQSGSGVTNAGAEGLLIRRSFTTATNTDFSGAAATCLTVNRGGLAAVSKANLTGAGTHGIDCVRGTVAGQDADVSGAADRGVLARNGSTVMFTSGRADNCAIGLLAKDAATISAPGATVTGNTIDIRVDAPGGEIAADASTTTSSGSPPAIGDTILSAFNLPSDRGVIWVENVTHSNRGTESGAVPIGSADSTGDVTVTVNHGLDDSPLDYGVEAFLTNPTANDYAAYVKDIQNVGATSFDVTVHIDSLCGTLGETADLSWRAERVT